MNAMTCEGRNICGKFSAFQRDPSYYAEKQYADMDDRSLPYGHFAFMQHRLI